MTIQDKDRKLSRRNVLKSGGGVLVGMTILPGSLIIGAGHSWAAQVKSLKPETFATLVQMSRDTYPHDRIGDDIYAKAVMGFDAAAAKSKDDQTFFEQGVDSLNAAAKNQHGVAYAQVKWEVDRASLLRSIEDSAFFQRVRSSLVTGIYNNPDIWPIFGFEGESASQGGYINRGFDDIDWLDQV